MCGIVGFVNFDGHHEAAANALVRKMTALLAHRGPDADGYYVDGNAALGHARLAIIDLATGQQPMAVEGGLLQIVFNGEIYNYVEIRRELESAGVRFRTNSDTEVILRAYVKWGDRCVDRLNGMFAFAIWDLRNKTLVLARDRVGKKPLYLWKKGPSIAFASELKALRVGDFDPGEVDPEAIDCYLTMGYVPTPMSIYSGIRKLPSARILTVSESGHNERQYWSLKFSPQSSIAPGEAVEEFRSLFDDAVRCRLVSEVPLGAFLSSGIDSSLVVTSMAKVMDEPVKTHTISFKDKGFDESEVAREIALHIGAEHREFQVEPKAADILGRVAWHFDEPFADSSALPTWYVCEKTRQSVTVALSGDGGDEAFGGYSFRYIPHSLESAIRRQIPAAIRSPLFGMLGAVWPASQKLPRPLRWKSIFENLATSDVRAFYRDMTWLHERTRAAVYRSDFARDLKGFSPLEVVARPYMHNDAVDALGRGQYTDINVYMTDDVLAKVDRMSMAHSLEVRAPFLDFRVLEFAARLPKDLKIGLRNGKLLLRRAAVDRLPAKALTLPKRGFSIPAADWLRKDLRDIVTQFVLRKDGIVSDYLNIAIVEKLWREHLSGHRDHSVFLWGLMMLGFWDSIEKDRRSAINAKVA